MVRNYGCNVQLRSVQQEAMDNVFDRFNEGKNRLLVVGPPAIGKTAMMAGIAKHYMKIRPNSVVLVLSHLSLLIEQSGSSFKKFWSVDTDTLQADNKPDPNSRCILSTVQSSSILHKIVEFKNKLPEGRTVELILLDEAHLNSGVERIDKILDTYFPKARVVGFTGSPFKENKSMAELFDDTAYSVSVEQAIQMGILVAPKLHGIMVDKKMIEDVMAKCLNIVRANHSNDKCVVFMKTIKDSDAMAEIFNKAGFKAISVTSALDDKIREKVLIDVRDNKEGSHQILTSVDVLSVGFDAPYLKAIIMPYGTGSVSLYLQRIGRGLRTAPNKTHCDIYIGGADPKIEQGKWEKITKKAMEAGRTEKKEEIPEGMGVDEFKVFTLEKKMFMDKIKRSNMTNLERMVGERKFPIEFLKHLVKSRPNNTMVGKATDKQKAIINKYIKVSSEGISKSEASALIDSIAKAKGWKDKPLEGTVPSGQYKGKLACDVPWAYRSRVTNPNGKYFNKELADYFAKYRRQHD